MAVMEDEINAMSRKPATTAQNDFLLTQKDEDNEQSRGEAYQ